MRAVPVKFNAVVVRIAEIQGFADSMIGCSIKRNFVRGQSFEGISQRCSGGINDGQMVEACCSRGRGRAIFALPRVEADVMVIAACGDESSGRTEPLYEIETEYAAIEG